MEGSSKITDVFFLKTNEMSASAWLDASSAYGQINQQWDADAEAHLLARSTQWQLQSMRGI